MYIRALWGLLFLRSLLRSLLFFLRSLLFFQGRGLSRGFLFATYESHI